jgi:dTDP-L-rhamnose 4-epimerase
VEAVCHQAAMVGHGVSSADAPDYAYNNDYATAVLLAGMAERGVRRLVLASSMVVYGEGRYECAEHGAVRVGRRGDGEFEHYCPRCGAVLRAGLVSEDAPLEPQSTYAASKLAQELYVSAWARQTGGSAFALRYHNVYGPWMPRNTPYAGVASIFRSALESGQSPKVMEDGGQLRDFVHVRDVALANVLALETQGTSGIMEPLNVCSGQRHTIGELATELAVAASGPAPVIVGGVRPMDVRHVTADSTRARDRIGFRAAIDFSSGIKEFAQAPLRD